MAQRMIDTGGFVSAQGITDPADAERIRTAWQRIACGKFGDSLEPLVKILDEIDRLEFWKIFRRGRFTREEFIRDHLLIDFEIADRELPFIISKLKAGEKVDLKRKTAELASTVQPVAALGTNQHNDGSGCYKNENVTPSSDDRGNSASYQLARLKRDHPEVVERVISGEIKSARAAMREVGLAPPLLTPVQKLVRQFQRLSPDEQQDFLDAINDINP